MGTQSTWGYLDYYKERSQNEKLDTFSLVNSSISQLYQ